MSAPICVNLALERAYLAARLNGIGHSRREASALDLSHPAHAEVLLAIQVLLAAGKEPSPITVAASLAERGRLLAAGGKRTIEDLWRHAPSLATDDAAEELARLARGRRLLEVVRRVQSTLVDQRIEEAAELLRQGSSADMGNVDSFDVEPAYETMAAAYAEQMAPESPRKAMGLEVFDRYIGGLPPGSLTVIGGGTGAGKSTLMLLMATRMAEHGARPGVISLEDPRAVWGARLIGERSGVSSLRFQRGACDATEYSEVARGIERARDLPLDLGYAVGRNVAFVIDMIRFMVRARQRDVIFVDYLQALDFSDHRSPRHDRAISDAVRGLKGVCAQLGVPVLLGSQISRPEKTQTVREPRLSDLKESGDIENDAEVVLLLWPATDDPNAEILGKLGKLKWGPRGLRFSLRRDPYSGAAVDVE